MKTTMQILPGIKFIGWVERCHVPQRVDLEGICGHEVRLLTDVHEILFTDEPECVLKTERKGAAYQDTVTLKFHSTEALPRGEARAYIVTDVEGHSWLIGSREAPGAVLEYDRSCGLPAGEAAGFAYKVEHVAVKSLIPCVV